ncbi:MAG: esterase-like activity of phytase family protein [Sphingobium sp.]|nr:esterase-like activity of phytase family protein [Sphingobium sp.]
MRKSIALALCSLAMPMAAHAAPQLIAVGTLSGTEDKSGLTGLLENGIDHQNVLGGTGSGFAYAGGNTFLGLVDRGPNATAYAGGAAVDNTQSYIARFHTMTMQPTANGGPGLPYLLTPQLDATTLFFSGTPLAYGNVLGNGAPAQNDATHYYFTGRSDGYDPTKTSTFAGNARFDPEGIRVSNDGKSIFVSDEYGPYIKQFDRATGELIKTFALPANLAIANQAPVEKGATGEIAINTSGRTTNKGMEGLAITPDGKTLVGIMQAALIQDAKAAKKLLRIVTVDVDTGATHEYAYKLGDGSGVSEIVALNDHQFLVDERDGAGLGGDPAGNPFVKRLYLIDIAGATDITAMDGATALTHAVTKSASPFLDVGTALISALGITANQVPSKIEGLAFGYDIDGMHTLWVTNDNDYLEGASGPNKFYVFGFTDADLRAAGFGPFVAQQGVPEPASWALMIGGFALAGAAMRRRKATVRFA